MYSAYPRYTTITVLDLAGVVRENLASTFESIDENIANYLKVSEADILHQYVENELIPYLIKTYTSAIAVNLWCSQDKRVIHKAKILTLEETKLLIKDMLTTWGRTIESMLLRAKRKNERISISSWAEVSDNNTEMKEGQNTSQPTQNLTGNPFAFSSPKNPKSKRNDLLEPSTHRSAKRVSRG